MQQLLGLLNRSLRVSRYVEHNLHKISAILHALGLTSFFVAHPWVGPNLLPEQAVGSIETLKPALYWLMLFCFVSPYVTGWLLDVRCAVYDPIPDASHSPVELMNAKDPVEGFECAIIERADQLEPCVNLGHFAFSCLCPDENIRRRKYQEFLSEVQGAFAVMRESPADGQMAGEVRGFTCAMPLKPEAYREYRYKERDTWDLREQMIDPFVLDADCPILCLQSIVWRNKRDSAMDSDKRRRLVVQLVANHVAHFQKRSEMPLLLIGEGFTKKGAQLLTRLGFENVGRSPHGRFLFQLDLSRAKMAKVNARAMAFAELVRQRAQS
jgi:hypothetical protein